MANPTVDKLKDFGLRYGEKVGMGVAVALCLVFIGQAMANRAVKITPEELQISIKTANASINRSVPRATIEQELAGDQAVKLTIPDLKERVAKNDAARADTGTQQAAIDKRWVTPEPNAGAIREKPVLLAIADPDAFPGRGGPELFLRDASGKRIMVDPNEKADEAKGTKKSGRGNRERAKPVDPEEKRKKELARLQQRAAIAGGDENAAAKDEKADTKDESTDGKEPKSGLVGKRWVVLLGTVDNKKLRENWAKALKLDLASAYPHYLRVDVQRQELNDDGTWSDWQVVDYAKNHLVQGDITDAEEEKVPQDVVIHGSLVDQLPFLKVGYWRGVFVDALVSADEKQKMKEKQKEEDKALADSGGEGYDMAKMGAAYSKAMRQSVKNNRNQTGYSQMTNRGGGGGARQEDLNFERRETSTLMVRSLDFTVEPGATYRYRLRLVVANPNFERNDVMPGTDVASKELTGPWAEVPYAVKVPADVSTYVLHPSGAGDDKVVFQVASWRPADGQTIVRDFDAGPGQLIGAKTSATVPSYEGKESKPQSVDFTSHLLVLGTAGGTRPVQELGLSGADFAVPATALLLRPNGALELASQARDTANAERKEMKETYALALKETAPRKKGKTGAFGMMGGYGGGGGGRGRGGRGGGMGGYGGGYGGGMGGGYGGGRR
ncbi:MAG TPA: hypothetical protein VG406_10915 [Isosphaeraceae bacterium]|nr:hypothetical protein [Isosphaeraceae bacterium]